MQTHTLARNSARLSWALQVVAAAILGQTLFFKFTAAPESVYIFDKLGLEPWGRLGTGALELIAVVLLLVPRTIALGALLTIGLMGGAIFSHLTQLGVVITVGGESDGGLLFALAVVTLLAASIVAWLRRYDVPVIGSRLAHAP